MRKDIPQIAMTYRVLHSEGVNDLKAIAEQYHAQQTHLDNSGMWSYDRYLKNSSDSRAEISSALNDSYKECSIWSINHYLGFNRHPYVIEKAKAALDIYGTGCGTSAMSGGHSELHKKLQERFAKIFSKEECLLFSTGFTANSGAISTLCRGSETLIIIDRASHASIVEGCKSSGSQYISFKHNSVSDLEKRLNQYSSKYHNILVVVEAAYSMEGDIAPLREIVELKKKYNFLLYVDEAHTFGFYGKNGAGMCNELGISEGADFIMTTLSKSTASIGGIIATSKHFASLLRWSNTYLFQAAIPPSDAAAIDACLDLMENEPAIIEALWEKTKYLRQKLIDLNFDIGKSKSPIIPVFIRDSEILAKMEKDLFNEGIFTVAVPYPAVKANEVRFRFIVNNSHTKHDIDHLVEVLTQLGTKYNLIPNKVANETNITQ